MILQFCAQPVMLLTNNGEMSLLLSFQMASGLQSWVEDHSNITMFNFIAYPIFSKTHHDTDSKHPLQKTIKGKNSLSLSPSHLKEHNCLSLIKLQKKTKKKKKARNLVDSEWNWGENCAFLRPWSGIVITENTKPRCRHHHHAKRVLRPHYAQVWVKVITWQWSNSW